MGRCPRSLLLGVVVLVAVIVSAGTASSSPGAHPGVVRGGVEAIGQPDAAPTGWQVRHPSPGVYRISVRAPHADLDVSSWDSVADVTVRPLGGGANEVRFSVDGTPVDASFSFVALTRR